MIENKYIACLGFFYVFVSLTSCDFAESNNKVGVGSTLIQPSAKLGENWVLLEEYSDEFNGITLDREKWDNDIPDTGWKSWEPENILVKDGVLQLVMQYKEHFRGDLKLYYTSGAISTKAGPFKYGYSEIRLKAAPLHPGVVSAFWARGKSEGMRTEIDFVEMPQQRRVNIIDFSVHIFEQPELREIPLHERREWWAPWDPRADFHVYGCEWNENKIKWYVDGRLMASRDNDYWHQALEIIISLGLRPPLTLKNKRN